MKRAATKKHIVAVLLAGAAVELLVLQAFGAFGGGLPTELTPSSMPLVLLYMVGLGPLALGIPVVTFWAWGFPLFSGAATFPLRSVVLAAAAFCSSALWLILGHASEYYDWPLFGVSGGFVFAIVFAIAWCRRRPSFLANLLGHALLFAWLGSFAFPWIGEVP